MVEKIITYALGEHDPGSPQNGKRKAKCGALSTSTIYLHKYKLCVNLHETQVRRFPCLVSKWLTLCCSVEFLNKEEKADIYLLNPIAYPKKVNGRNF